MPQTDPDPNERELVSYRTLRRVIGASGILLPILVALGHIWIEGRWVLLPSISAYHGTGMRDVFVGILISAGLFLFAYRGYDDCDDWSGNVACVFALCVALFPITCPAHWVQVVHVGSGLGLFSVFAWFSIGLFTKTGPGHDPTDRKRLRNLVYRACGVSMIACIVAIVAFYVFWSDTAFAAYQPVFWLESGALWAFGVSWTIKGDTFLQDPKDA